MPGYLLTDFFNSGTPTVKNVTEDLCKMAIACAVDLGLNTKDVRVDTLSL